MEKRWGPSGLWTVVIIVLYIVAVMPSSLAADVAGIIYGLGEGDVVKVSIVNNNEDCEGACTITFDSAGAYTRQLDYGINDTLTIYTYYKDVLNSDTKVAGTVPFQLDLTLCTPPYLPQTYEIGETHQSSVELHWLADGADYSVVSVDNADYYEQESPVVLSNISAGNHTWRVKTCGGSCCSKEVISTFRVLNEAPLAPAIREDNGSLHIEAGQDNDTDDTFVEYRINDGSVVRSDRFEIGNMKISARTCDAFVCSAWTTANIASCGILAQAQGDNTPASASDAINYSSFLSDLHMLLTAKGGGEYAATDRTVCEQQVSMGVDTIRELFSARASEAISYTMDVSGPDSAKVGDKLVFTVNMRADQDYEMVRFEVLGIYGFTSKDIPVRAGEAVTVRLMADTRGMDAITSPAIVTVTADGKTIYSREFMISLFYTMSDFEYQLNELRVSGSRVIDFFTGGFVILSLAGISVVLYLYLRLKRRFSAELITEARLQRDRDLAMRMLSQKKAVNTLRQDAQVASAQVTPKDVEQLRAEMKEKTGFDLRAEELEHQRDPYLQRDQREGL